MGSRMPYWGQVVAAGTHAEFLEGNGVKALLFTNKKRPSALFKAITSKYRDRISFGLVQKSDQELLDIYAPTKMPALCVLKDSEPIWFSGEFNLDELSEFLDPLAPKSKQKKSGTTAVTELEKDLEIINEVKTLHPDNFEKEVLQRDKVAFIHFYNSEAKDDVWEEMTELYKGAVLMGEFDCDDEKDWLYAKELGVGKLPSIRIFPQKKEEDNFTMSWTEK